MPTLHSAQTPFLPQAPAQTVTAYEEIEPAAQSRLAMMRMGRPEYAQRRNGAPPEVPFIVGVGYPSYPDPEEYPTPPSTVPRVAGLHTLTRIPASEIRPRQRRPRRDGRAPDLDERYEERYVPERYARALRSEFRPLAEVHYKEEDFEPPYSYQQTVRDREEEPHPFYTRYAPRVAERYEERYPEERYQEEWPTYARREAPKEEPRAEPEAVLVLEMLNFIRRKLDAANNKPIPLSTLGNLLAQYRAAHNRPKSRSGLLHCLNASSEFEVFNPDREVGKGSGSKLVVRRLIPGGY